MIKSRIHNELFYIFVREIKLIAYQNAEKDRTLDSWYRTRSIYWNYCIVEYTIYSAKNVCICSRRVVASITY